MRLLSLLLFLSCLITSSLWAAEELAPVDGTPTADLTAPGITPTEVPSKLGDQNPSRTEEEKAPITSRPTAVPKFTLPDVIITGKNELTIGAKRLETLESDVSWGAESLTQVNRATDDLPGLDKSLTALSTQETGESQNSAFILHAGGGVPGTFGGWGLLGKDFTDMQYVLFGSYSTWAGQSVNGSNDGDQKYKFGGEFKITPDKDAYVRLSIYSEQVQANLPYQSAITEVHQGLDTSADIGWKWSEHWHSNFLFSGRVTTLNYWDQTPLNNQTQEFKGTFRLNGENIDPLWDSFGLEAGGYQADSNFAVAPNNSYNMTWASLKTGFNVMPSIKLSGSVEGQTGNGPNLDSKIFPAAQLQWRIAEPTQIRLYWKTARVLDSFYDTFMYREHISPESELPTASETTGEWGGQWTQQLDPSLVWTLSASTAQVVNYHQWTDINASSPNYIETYNTLSSVQITKAKADLQWKLDSVWSTDLNYQWTQGDNNSGNGFNMTFLPQNQGSASLTRADDQWEATVTLVAASERQALDATTLTLPAYATINLSGAYHFDHSFSLWLRGDNLLGLNYVLEPGYLEPQVHIRGGIEIVL